MNQVGSLLLQNIECEVYCQGRLIFIPSQNHILYCLANSFFYDKFISWPGENVPGILPLPPNLPIFISSWQGRILSTDFLFCGESAGFLLRAFGEFSFLSWFWNSMRIVSLHEWVFFIDGQGNGHSICVCYVDYSFYKTKINPLKLIVTDAQTNFVQYLYHQLCFRVIMKQFGQAYVKRIVFFSIKHIT